MESQNRKVVSGVVGVVLGIIGLFLTGIWWEGVVWLLKSVLPLLFLGLGLHLILKALGISWRDLTVRVAQVGTELFSPAKSTHVNRAVAVTLQCPNCGAGMPSGTTFCLQCGNPLPQPKVCLKCQRVNVPEASFCGHCGAKL